MNNFLFGDSTFGYYETIGGGTGATHTANGEDAVHSHMTNTRLTDVEVLEKRYPVRLVRFGIRRGSGGYGQHSEGDGVGYATDSTHAIWLYASGCCRSFDSPDGSRRSATK